MNDNIIIIEIVEMQGSVSEISQGCSQLTNNFYSQSGSANTAYTFRHTDLNAPLKVKVGAVEYLLEPMSGGTKIRLYGTCNSAHWANFQVNNQILEYDDGTLEFTTDCVLVDGARIDITVQANTSLQIDAFAG